MASLLADITQLAGSIPAPSEAPRTGRPPIAPDIAKWVTSAEPALRWTHGAFMESYAANRQSVVDAAIEGNPFAEAILVLITDRSPWSGTATELLQTLRAHNQLLADGPHSLPRQANKLTSELQRVQSLLRSRGVSVTFERRGKAGNRVICTNRPNLSSAPSASSTKTPTADDADGADDKTPMFLAIG